MRRACWALALVACGNGSNPAGDARVADAPISDAPVADASMIDAELPDAILPDAGPVVCDPPGDAGPGTNLGFVPPTEVTAANQDQAGVWVEIGPADWSCLGTPSDDVATTVAVELSGGVTDFQTGNAVSDATVAAFATGDVSIAPDDSVVADTNGDYTGLSLPAGTLRPTVRVSAPNALDTLTVQIDLEPDQTTQQLPLSSVAQITADALPAFIGVTRTPGTGLAVGRIRDCAGNFVSHAVATISALPDCVATVDGTTYYFSAGTTTLPVRHSQQSDSNSDGLFMIIELEPTATAWLQVWGYVDGQTPGSDPMTLLAQVPAPVLADSVVLAVIDPLRTP